MLTEKKWRKKMKVKDFIATRCMLAAEKIRSLFNTTREDAAVLATDERGEAYIGEAIKILIAVVIGALLLTLIYTLMRDTVFATVTAKITALFNYSGT